MKRRATSLGAGIAALFLIAGCGSAGQIATTASAPVQAPGQIDAIPLAAPNAPVAGGVGQSLKVHGSWTIDVRNPNGTIASHTEFENSLWVGQGELALASFLGRTNSVGLWDVSVDNGNSGSPYAFVQSREPADGGDLTVTVPAANQGQVVLQGSARATAAFTADRVSTGVQQCPTSIAPAATTRCPGGYRAFTLHGLAPGIAIADGQSVETKIVFSFS
jgi:hypothetical protein